MVPPCWYLLVMEKGVVEAGVSSTILCGKARSKLSYAHVREMGGTPQSCACRRSECVPSCVWEGENGYGSARHCGDSSHRAFGVACPALSDDWQQQNLHIPQAQWRTIGALEYLGVIGLIVGFWLPWVGLAASIGLAILMIGAVVSRVRAGGKQGTFIAFDVVVFVLAVALALLQLRAM
jgi:hypothetical protein